jgi:hypothetical protein
VRQHGDIIAGALLDLSFAPIITTICNEPATLAYAPTPIFEDAAKAGINAAIDYKSFTGGRMPDMLASGQQCFERDYERAGGSGCTPIAGREAIETPALAKPMDLGQAFLAWLKQGLVSGELPMNTVNARVHRVREASCW